MSIKWKAIKNHDSTQYGVKGYWDLYTKRTHLIKIFRQETEHVQKQKAATYEVWLVHEQSEVYQKYR